MSTNQSDFLQKQILTFPPATLRFISTTGECSRLKPISYLDNSSFSKAKSDWKLIIFLGYDALPKHSLSTP